MVKQSQNLNETVNSLGVTAVTSRPQSFGEMSPLKSELGNSGELASGADLPILEWESYSVLLFA